jgi:periplasmic protein TonB
METMISSFDDLIFSGRNKEYGAYANRRNYSRYLFTALFIATSVFCAGFSAPLLARYFGENPEISRHIAVMVDPTLIQPVDKQEPPELPEIKEQKPAPNFKKIMVTVEPGIAETDISELQEQGENQPVTEGDGPGVPETKTPEKPIIENDDVIPTVTLTDLMPEFPGGDPARQAYLAKNTKYPNYDKAADIQGTVYLRFIVDENGWVRDIEILRGVSPGLDAEAIRVLQNMPRWSPGLQNGKPVRVVFSLPIKFVLH